MKKLLSAVCLTVLTLTSCQQAKQKVFEIASQEVNKQCPMTIDEMTRMDSTSYTGGDNTFTYYYTLTGTADDPAIAETTQKQLAESLPEIIKNTDDLKIYREMDVTMLYVYLSDKTHKELFRVKITPDLYK
ncbi:hypothetical protein [Bacteroides sp.]|uniref:hypothetical protein n=1 Tax=Bacteroides sp. TaxID=29523 RepID=UPI0025C507E1|nr:hypothetical protein [Bacteroides sp.]